MFLAVDILKNAKTPVGIVFCVPVFILAGFEHSIADMFYFFTARLFTGEMILFLVIVVLGNTVSQRLLPRVKNADIWPEITGSDHCPVVLELSE